MVRWKRTDRSLIWDISQGGKR